MIFDQLDNDQLIEIWEDVLSEFKIVEPYRLMGVFYYESAIQFMEYSNHEHAIRQFEKAIAIDPTNLLYLELYKMVIFEYYTMLSSKNSFIPNFQNALVFLKNDPSFISHAIIIVKDLIFIHLISVHPMSPLNLISLTRDQF